MTGRTYTKAELIKKKGLAEAILKSQGKNLDDELGAMYEEIIETNYDYLKHQLEKPAQVRGQQHG